MRQNKFGQITSSTAQILNEAFELNFVGFEVLTALSLKTVSVIKPRSVFSVQGSECVHKWTAVGQRGDVDAGCNQTQICSDCLLGFSGRHVLDSVHDAISPGGTLPRLRNGE